MNNVTRLLGMEVRSDGAFVAVLILKRHGDADLEFQWGLKDVPKIIEALQLCATDPDVASSSKFVQRSGDWVCLSDYKRTGSFQFSPEGARNLAELLATSLKRELEELRK